MTQPPSKPPQSQRQPTKPPKSQLQTKWGQRTEKLLINVWEPIDVVGKGLMGELWRTLYLSVQDAIALALLLQIPGLIGFWIIGKNFSSFDVCLLENPLGVTFYACLIIVISDFLLWIILFGRIIGRFWEDFSSLWQGKRGGKYGAGKP
jgi:hypothetical protein